MEIKKYSSSQGNAQFPEDDLYTPVKSLAYNLDLIWHLVKRDFSLRYKRSTLGILWSLVLPLAQLLVLIFIFQIVVPLHIDSYPAFLFTALLPWTWFSTCLSSAGGLFNNNRDLVWQPNFQPANLIIINMLSNFLLLLIALPILFILLVLYGRPLTLSLIFLPSVMLIQGILIVGLDLIIATQNVFYRDVEHIVEIALMLLFYMTPVFYRSQSISESYHKIYVLNPIAVLVENYRAILFYGTNPEWGSLLFTGIVSMVVCAIGYLIYSRQLHNVMDKL
ncbi:MAG: ABC transporter permease [Ignavibacteriales bacterium]